MEETKTALSNLAKTFENFKSSSISEEHNIFEIGTRRFYENAFTEILSYILSSKFQGSTELRTKIIDILFEDIKNKDLITSIQAFAECTTQHRTADGKYIDLVVYNSDFVVVFENKIFHHSNSNPFESYRDDIKQRFKTRREHVFVVLSYVDNFCPEGWNFLPITEKFSKIIDYDFNLEKKWDFYVKDFLTNYSKKELQMTELEKCFYEENFHKIILAHRKLDLYITDTAEKFALKNSVKRWKLSSSWNYETKAIRFFPVIDESNVVLIFNTDGTFSVSLYYYVSYKEQINELSQFVGEHYENWPEADICCFTIRQGCFSKLSEALDECEKQLNSMRDFYLKNSLT